MDQVCIGLFISNERKRKKITQLQFADLLGVSEKTIGNWEHARCMPDISMLKLICNILDVKLEELLDGKRHDDNYYVNDKKNNLIREPILIGNNIKEIRLSLKMSQHELSKKINLSKVYLYKLENGLIVPSLENLTLISNALNVSIEDLIYLKK